MQFENVQRLGTGIQIDIYSMIKWLNIVLQVFRAIWQLKKLVVDSSEWVADKDIYICWFTIIDSSHFKMKWYIGISWNI